MNLDADKGVAGDCEWAYLESRLEGGKVDAGALERLRGLPGGVGDHRRGELQGLLAGALQHR